MRAFTFTERIDRPPHEVWAALTDLPSASRWRPLVRSMEMADGGPIRAGGRLRITIELGGRTRTSESEIVAFVPGRQWTLRSGRESLQGVFDYRLEPDGAGTRVIATCDLKARGLGPWLALPLIARSERRLRRPLLGNLKRFVETGGGAGALRA